MPRRWIAAALALFVVAALGYAGRRLWLKSDDLLRPVVVVRGADPAALANPPLRARLAALTGRRPAAPSGPKRIALTFDDGPYPVTTPLLLQTLGDLGVRATFFVIGRDAEQYPELTRAIVAAGDEVADHTQTHPDLSRLDAAAVAAELRAGAATLARIVPERGAEFAARRLFRPPHGRYTAETLRTAQAEGFDTILWTDDPGDWRAVPPQVLREHVLARATAPEILLLHSGRMATIAALPELVRRFRSAGYAFVTVGDLLREIPPQRLNAPARTPLARS